MINVKLIAIGLDPRGHLITEARWVRDTREGFHAAYYEALEDLTNALMSTTHLLAVTPDGTVIAQQAITSDADEGPWLSFECDVLEHAAEAGGAPWLSFECDVLEAVDDVE